MERGLYSPTRWIVRSGWRNHSGRIGRWLHTNPLPLAGAFLLRYWHDILFYAGGLFILGVFWDYGKWRDRETSFQEALIDTLNTINSRLEAIEAVLKERDEGRGSD